MKNGVKKLRLKIGLSQAKFAKAIGQNQSTIANYETGYRDPNKNAAYAIIDLAKNHGIELSLEDIYLRP